MSIAAYSSRELGVELIVNAGFATQFIVVATRESGLRGPTGSTSENRDLTDVWRLPRRRR